MWETLDVSSSETELVPGKNKYMQRTLQQMAKNVKTNTPRLSQSPYQQNNNNNNSSSFPTHSPQSSAYNPPRASTSAYPLPSRPTFRPDLRDSNSFDLEENPAKRQRRDYFPQDSIAPINRFTGPPVMTSSTSLELHHQYNLNNPPTAPPRRPRPNQTRQMPQQIQSTSYESQRYPKFDYAPENSQHMNSTPRYPPQFPSLYPRQTPLTSTSFIPNPQARNFIPYSERKFNDSTVRPDRTVPPVEISMDVPPHLQSRRPPPHLPPRRPLHVDSIPPPSQPRTREVIPSDVTSAPRHNLPQRPSTQLQNVPFRTRSASPRTSPPSRHPSSLLPSTPYLNNSNLPSKLITPNPLDPPLLILDINNTLLFRTSRTAHGSRNARHRPYLSTFLSYVCGPAPVVEESGKVGRRWLPIIYSSARASNVLAMLTSMKLVDEVRVKKFTSSKETNERAGGGEENWKCLTGDPLALVWSRENMGLSQEEFRSDLATYKDLSLVWGLLGLKAETGMERSILLDDEKAKAILQPYNHLPIEAFSPEEEDTPRSRRRIPAPSPFIHYTIGPTSSSPTPPPTSPSPLSPLRTTKSRSSTPQQSKDTALLSTIYLLHTLSTQSNIPSFISSGGLSALFKLGEEEAVRRGVGICDELGIEVKREFEEGWWDVCVKRRQEMRGPKVRKGRGG